MQGSEGQKDKSIENFVDSEVFARLFKEGMMMVEEAAGYLEGPGRQIARTLSRRGALAYAAESMRLTTRLMHVASWLLVQRSIRRREMTPSDAGQPKYSLGGRDTGAGRRFLGTPELPPALQNLVSRSHRLYERVARLDDLLYERQVPANDGFDAEEAGPGSITESQTSAGTVVSIPASRRASSYASGAPIDAKGQIPSLDSNFSVIPFERPGKPSRHS